MRRPIWSFLLPLFSLLASVYLTSLPAAKAYAGDRSVIGLTAQPRHVGTPDGLTIIARNDSDSDSGNNENDRCAAASQTAARFERQGKLQAARAGLTACLSPACPGQVKVECERQLAAISVAMPAVTLVIKDEASHDITAVHVTIDGRTLLDRIDAGPIAVDPGEHRFVFESAGFRKMETTVLAEERNKKTRVVVYLNNLGTPDAAEDPADDPSGASSGASSKTAGPSVAGPAIAASAPRSGGIWNRKVALGLGGVGVAGVTVGVIWAILAKSKYDHALASECDGDASRCSLQGIADGRTAHNRAMVATVGFATGGAFLAAAAAVYLNAPKPGQVGIAPTVVDGSGGLTVVGQW